MRTRRSFIPIDQAQVGMVLSKPVGIIERGYLSLTLPAGHALTDENLHQLSACHAEFIGIELADTRSDEQVAIDAAQAAHRAMQIFEGADLTEANMAVFFDQILTYRSA